MDPNLKKSFSYPNSDQYNDQVNKQSDTGGFVKKDEILFQKRETVNLMDALAKANVENGDVQNVRTYQSDIASTIKNDNVSMIKIALSEKKRQERTGALDDTLENKSKNIYLLIGIVFTVLVIAGLIAGFIYLKSKTSIVQTNAPQQKVQQILYTETSSILNIDQINISDLIRIIEKDKEAVIELGNMKAIVLTQGRDLEERTLTSSEFFRIINTRAPDVLVRALEPNYLLGVYGFSPSEMFAVFRVNSYDAAFAGMFEWEPNIESDIGDLFINKDNRVARNIGALSSAQNTGSTTASTTSSGQASPFGILSQRKFVDKVMSNKDTRVLIDSNGKESMLYTFIDKETLVIATTEKSLKEIIFRLTTGRIVR